MTSSSQLAARKQQQQLVGASPIVDCSSSSRHHHHEEQHQNEPTIEIPLPPQPPSSAPSSVDLETEDSGLSALERYAFAKEGVRWEEEDNHCHPHPGAVHALNIAVLARRLADVSLRRFLRLIHLVAITEKRKPQLVMDRTAWVQIRLLDEANQGARSVERNVEWGGGRA